MEWTADGIVLGVKRHGEANAIIEVLTEDRGRHLGLVKGGRSKRLRPILQVGNHLDLTWRARLEEHLGTFTVEPKTLRAGVVMASGAGLHLLNTLCALCLLLAEREAHPRLFRALNVILDSDGGARELSAYLLRFELAFLDELGFGLDVSKCAATGGTDDLIYVSPKSGRAVSAEAGAPYHDRMLPLPSCIITRSFDGASEVDLLKGLELTGYFLDRHIFEPRSKKLPLSREKLREMLVSIP